VGTTAEGCVWDGRESRQDGPGARTKLVVERRQRGTRAWDLDPVTNRSAARRARGRGGLLVGGLDFRVRSRQEAHGLGERLQQRLERAISSRMRTAERSGYLANRFLICSTQMVAMFTQKTAIHPRPARGGRTPQAVGNQNAFLDRAHAWESWGAKTESNHSVPR